MFKDARFAMLISGVWLLSVFSAYSISMRYTTNYMVELSANVRSFEFFF